MENNIAVILICIGTFISTLFGGLFALRFKSKLYLILGFSAGAVIGIAFFDLMPESLELSAGNYGARAVTSVIGIGFVFYLLLDKVILITNRNRNTELRNSSIKGAIAALSLTLHSFVDGVAIGIAFQVSDAIGGMVAAAVLIHDFADGINTTNVILKENGTKRNALKWLLVNAVAPIIGAISTLFYRASQQHLGLLLAVVAGFFLYIGASDFLPESQKKHPGLITSLMTILGILILLVATRISGL